MELEMNGVMVPRIDEVLQQLDKEGSAYLEREAGRLRASKDQAKPKGSTGPSYDEMMASLLLQVAQQVRENKIADDKRDETLRKGVKTHRQQLVDRTEEIKKEIAHEEAEARKHITSEDMHEGFSVGVRVFHPSLARD
jgi:cell division cycle protein 37